MSARIKNHLSVPEFSDYQNSDATAKLDRFSREKFVTNSDRDEKSSENLWRNEVIENRAF